VLAAKHYFPHFGAAENLTGRNSGMTLCETE
jgi:hypothetical protein